MAQMLGQLAHSGRCGCDDCNNLSHNAAEMRLARRRVRLREKRAWRRDAA